MLSISYQQYPDTFYTLNILYIIFWQMMDEEDISISISGFQFISRRLEEEDDEKIEEMIDDISTNEMFGSSILSNGDGDNWTIGECIH